MHYLQKKWRRAAALLLCLCTILTLFGCQDPTEPTGGGEPAQVKVMTLNVAYYDGIFTNNQGFSSRRPAVSFEGAFCINYFFTPKYAPAEGITL